MSTFFLRRLILMVPTLLGATLFVFLIMRVVPGDVALMILIGDDPEGAAEGVDKKQLKILREKLGLDRPLIVQYVTWIADIARFDLGESLFTRHSISKEIQRRFFVTSQLAIMSIFVGFAAGLPLGAISALKHNSSADLISRVTSIIFLAVPNFWLGLLVLLVGVGQLNWMPPVGRNVLWENPGDNMVQMIFPSLIIGSSLMALVARMTRSSMLEVLREDYIRTARAKGLAERTVVVRHAMRNSMIPVITIISISFGNLLGGTVVMEKVFTIPGLGLLLLESISRRDYPVTQALVLLMAAGFIIINLLVDIMYGWLDPRISQS